MSRERWVRLAAGALLAIHAWLLLGAAAPSGSPFSPLAPVRKGPTFDEYFYVAAGVAYLRTGDFSENREHPPLAKCLAALPVAWAPGVELPKHWRDLLHFPIQFFYGRHGDQLPRNLFLARLPFVALALLVDLVLFRVARAAAGAAAALTSLGLLVFDPSWLASAATANLDFPAAAFAFLAMVALRRAALRPAAGPTLAAAVVLGAALLTKFTAVLLLPAGALLAAAASAKARSWRPAGAFALGALGALSVFAAGYGFESRSLASVRAHPKFAAGGGEPIESPALRAALLRVFGPERGVPLLTAMKGVDHMLSETGRRGHRGYLLGETSPERMVASPVTGEEKVYYSGWKSYYAVVLAQKLPLATLVLVVAGLLRLVRRRESAVELAFLLATPALVLAVFSTSGAQLGIKYVLPALPFLYLAAGRAAAGSRARAAAGALGVAGAALAALSIRPDFAMFSSVLAGDSDRGHRVAVIGDDWGQDAPGLALWARDLDAVAAAFESEGRRAGPATVAALDRFHDEHGREASGPARAGRDESRAITLAAARALRERGLAYRYYGEGRASAYGFPFLPLPAGPRRGLVAVHAANLHRESSDFGWLERFEPDATTGEPMPGIFRFLVRGRWIVEHRPIAKIGRAIFVYLVG